MTRPPLAGPDPVRTSKDPIVPPSNNELVQHWTTDHVPEAQRVDYYADALSHAIVPLGIENIDAKTFYADVRFAQLDAIAVCKVAAAPHGTVRGSLELSRTREHQFNLIVVLNCSWSIEHRGPQRLLPGDVMIHDSSYPMHLDIRTPSIGVNVAVTEDWLRRWLPSPSVLVGRRIDGQSAWGRALSAYLVGLSPELAAAPPIPLTVLADQVGSLLALAADDQCFVAKAKLTPALRSLHERIVEVIVQRCTEPDLTVHDVALSVNVSVRTLHRTLAAAGSTFGSELMGARVKTAERMLQSPLFRRVTTAEIGRRAGFLSASHFGRVVRKHTGSTPLQLRRSDL